MTTHTRIQHHLNIDLIPVDVFCDIYRKKPQTIYSWKHRNPKLTGIVFHQQTGTELHISIKGYEKWIRGEINTQQEHALTAKASKSNSGKTRAQRIPTKRSTGSPPQLT